MESFIDNKSDKSEEVFNLFIKSWEDFKKYYWSQKKRYSSNNYPGHVVCWKEDDIVLQLSRFFYSILPQKQLEDEGIEIHTQTDISKGKFRAADYTFSNSICNIKGKTIPDFIITKEDDRDSSGVNGSLWLIGEVKYLREYRSNWRDLRNDEDKRDRIQKDIDKLKAYKTYHICKKTVYLVADDFFHKPENKKIEEWEAIRDSLKEARGKIDFVDLIPMCSKISNCTCNKFNFEEFCKNNLATNQRGTN